MQYEVAELIGAADYTFVVVGLACFITGLIVGYVMGKESK